MRKLLLVRHGHPERIENLPAQQWLLSAKGDVMLVTHGTLMSLFGAVHYRRDGFELWQVNYAALTLSHIEVHYRRDGFELWQELKMPDLMVFSLTDLHLDSMN